MIAGLLLTVAGYGALPLAEMLGAPLRPVWLVATQVLTGLGMALYLVNASPYLMAVTGPQERDHAFSLQSALWPLAAFVGSLVGGALPALWSRALAVSLDHPAPYRYTLLVAVTLLAPGIVPLCVARDIARDMRLVARETRPVAGRDKIAGNATARDPVAPNRNGVSAPLSLIAPIVLVGVLRVAGESAVRSFLNVYLDVARGLPPAQIGVLMALGQFVAVPAALAMPLVTARWSRQRTIALGALCTALCLLPLALIPHPVAAAASWIGLTTLVAIVRPAFMVYTQDLVHPRWQPLMSGATNLAAGLGSALMLLSGGYAVAALGFRRFFLIPAGLFAVAGAVVGVCLHREEGLGD
jgi:MFS family permease